MLNTEIIFQHFSFDTADGVVKSVPDQHSMKWSGTTEFQVDAQQIRLGTADNESEI